MFWLRIGDSVVEVEGRDTLYDFGKKDLKPRSETQRDDVGRARKEGERSLLFLSSTTLASGFNLLFFRFDTHGNLFS